MKSQKKRSLLMRGKWIVEIIGDGGSPQLSSGDLYHNDWVEKFVSRYMKAINPGEHIIIRQIEIKGKRLINPVFSYKDYDDV